MAIDIKHPGAFHRYLGKAPGAPITGADIKKGLAAGGHAAQMANFARNAKKFKHGGKKRKGKSNSERAERLYGKEEKSK